MRLSFFRAAALLLFFLPATMGAVQRTFVSAGSGSDSNPCTRALPCRNFTAALLQTDSGGEVVVLDSGGYGVVAITQSAALIAPAGVHAGITALMGDAIDVAAGSAGVVILRGLYLNGLGGALGIDFTGGATLHVENCVISGFVGTGVLGRSPGGDVYVKDTISRQNSEYGFRFLSTGAQIRASLDWIRGEQNGLDGVTADQNSLVTVTRSVVAGNSLGFAAFATTGVLNVESSTAAMNTNGIFANGTVRVRNSMITDNINGVEAAMGGSTISFGNNRLHGNGTNGTFTMMVPQQ